MTDTDLARPAGAARPVRRRPRRRSTTSPRRRSRPTSSPAPTAGRTSPRRPPRHSPTPAGRRSPTGSTGPDRPSLERVLERLGLPAATARLLGRHPAAAGRRPGRRRRGRRRGRRAVAHGRRRRPVPRARPARPAGRRGRRRSPPSPTRPARPASATPLHGAGLVVRRAVRRPRRHLRRCSAWRRSALPDLGPAAARLGAAGARPRPRRSGAGDVDCGSRSPCGSLGRRLADRRCALGALARRPRPSPIAAVRHRSPPPGQLTAARRRRRGDGASSSPGATASPPWRSFR